MKNIFLFISIFIVTKLVAQTGGTTTYSLLNLGYNARANGLGTYFITAKDQDVNLGVANPSLYNTKMHRSIGFNQALLAGGINYGMLTYAHDIKKLNGTFAGHLRYIDYGKLARLDEAGNDLGKFSASEYILGAGLGKQLNPMISVGGNLNLIYSQLDTYNSFGMSVDLAGTYENVEKQILVTALVKNFGSQIKSYSKEKRAPLPAEMQIAASYKLAHAPFRLSILAHHLNKWNISYSDPSWKPTVDALTGDTIPVKQPNFAQKLGEHFIFQAEIFLGKNIQIRTAFDYHKRSQMKIDKHPGMAGFSFGLGLQFKRLTVDYGFNIYSKAGYNNMLTLTSNLSKWKK